MTCFEMNFKKPITMKLYLIDDSITNNIYSLKAIYQENINRILRYFYTSTYQKKSLFYRYLIREQFIANLEKLKAIKLRIREVEEMHFRFGS